MTFDLVKVLTRTTSSDTTATSNTFARGHHSTHSHAEHHKHAPLPFLASPVDPEALQWVRNRKRASTGGIQRAKTVAQFDAEHSHGKSESALAHRIFRKQHEASTLELFFDLFFVGNLAVFTTKSAHVDLQTLSNYVGFFAILWTTWFHISMFDVRFYVDSVFTRICKFAAFGVMVSLVGLTQLYDAILQNTMSRSFQGIALVMFGTRLLLVMQYGVVLYFVREFDKTLIPMLLTMFVYFIAAFGFLGTWLEDRGQLSINGEHGARHVNLWYIFLAVEAIAIIVVSSIWRILSFKHTHLVERVGLLTLIVMGEGIIGLVKSTSYAIQGTEVTVWQETGIVAAAVLLIYLVYVLYFDNIDHHRFGTIGQQIWTLLHFPAHVAILLTVEGSSALIIWTACRSAIGWITEDSMPSLDDPAKGLATSADFINLLKTTYNNTATRFYYYNLTEVYDKFPDDLAKLNSSKAAYATPEWVAEVKPTLKKMNDYYEYFVYQNFGAEGPKVKLDKEKDYGGKVQLYEDGFKFTVMYFYVAAGALLFILAFLYWFGRKRKTRTEWVSIGVRLLAGMCLPIMIISPLTETNDDSFRFVFASLLIPIVTLALLLVIIVDNIVKAISERHYTIVEERRMSRASTYMSQGTNKGADSFERELTDEDSSYEMRRGQDKEHGSPELLNGSFAMDRARERSETMDDDDMAPLTRNAQRTPTVTFGGVTHRSRGYEGVGQDADDEDEHEITEYRGGEQLGHFRSESLRRP